MLELLACAYAFSGVAHLHQAETAALEHQVASRGGRVRRGGACPPRLHDQRHRALHGRRPGDQLRRRDCAARDGARDRGADRRQSPGQEGRRPAANRPGTVRTPGSPTGGATRRRPGGCAPVRPRPEGRAEQHRCRRSAAATRAPASQTSNRTRGQGRRHAIRRRDLSRRGAARRSRRARRPAGRAEGAALHRRDLRRRRVVGGGVEGAARHRALEPGADRDPRARRRLRNQPAGAPRAPTPRRCRSSR